ncbi:pyridoxamine 5'-phosphate oxidase family protein [Nesterenkonia ebinurensis]|uniref:pyridoxamine 5'-phosphate oxidase family protein n=1 Tax=Nesterenkonia ebinurensis TaxID=2608252 RepID=UPI00123CA69D|nr:pyridoxamine 5'-phosphate oxidase family protein [Nesterenkonia ebinurensis]
MMFDHPNNNPILVLTEDQCWKLLEGTQHGRLVGSVGGRIDIFPVNIVAQDHSIVFRTAPGTKLAQVAVNENVLIEADGILSDQAWSVVVRGTAKLLETAAEIAEAETRGLQPWVPGPKEQFVQVTPAEISGRHFAFGPYRDRELGEGSEAGGD